VISSGEKSVGGLIQMSNPITMPTRRSPKISDAMLEKHFLI